MIFVYISYDIWHIKAVSWKKESKKKKLSKTIETTEAIAIILLNSNFYELWKRGQTEELYH